MSDTDCGCCAGLDVETPARIDNPPGQSAIAYRVGVHGQFKESLLARLSSAELPALAGLSARDDGDFTIALCDALATTLDVLAFYQERIANENYLRTATERRSILELARLIGYELAPGVAASTFLAFTLQEVPGSPALAAGPVEIPVGAKVQSVPGPGEQPQTFETVAAVEARAEWNAIPVQTTLAWHPHLGDTQLWLAGVGSGLQPGDAILIVGQERLDNTGSERWDIRLLSEVTEDRASQRTRLGWAGPLGHVSPHTEPAGAGATVYVFRQRAGLFGHNAPDPRLMSLDNSNLAALTNGETGVALDWDPAMFSIQGSTIDLDAAYPKITPGQLARPHLQWADGPSLGLLRPSGALSGDGGQLSLAHGFRAFRQGHAHPAGHRRESRRLPLPPAPEPGAGSVGAAGRLRDAARLSALWRHVGTWPAGAGHRRRPCACPQRQARSACGFARASPTRRCS